MAIKILEVKKESCPATLFIGKRYNRSLRLCGMLSSRKRGKQ